MRDRGQKGGTGHKGTGGRGRDEPLDKRKRGKKDGTGSKAGAGVDRVERKNRGGKRGGLVETQGTDKDHHKYRKMMAI